MHKQISSVSLPLELNCPSFKLKSLLATILENESLGTGNDIDVAKQIFDFGNMEENTGFQDLITGAKVIRRAHFAFGNQYQAIVDIVFDDYAYNYCSEGWKASKLLEMLEELPLELPEGFSDEESFLKPSMMPTFKYFLINCKETLPRESVKEIRKLCNLRVSTIRKKSSGREELALDYRVTQRKSLAFQLIRKADEIKKPRKGRNISKSHGIKEIDKSMDALDLDVNTTSQVPIRSSSKGTLVSRLSHTPMKVVSEVVLTEPHRSFQSKAQWDNIKAEGKNPELVTVPDGYVCEIGYMDYPSEWNSEFTEIINSHMDFAYYEEKISKVSHKNYLGIADKDLVMYAISLEKTSPTYLMIVHTVERTYKFITTKDVKPKDILKALPTKLQLHKFGAFRSSNDANLDAAFIRVERSYRVNQYKFGVLYCTEGQTDENDMFANNNLSKEYLQFLDFLGEKITLKGWNRFKGGLDVKSNTTGESSIFTSYRGYEIMFHVATMLPYIETDEQQLERKRHLGNDVVVIVYKEGNQKFNPACIHSMFNHMFIVIQNIAIGGEPKYKVEVVYKDNVPYPPLPLVPKSPIFSLNEKFHKFLMAKLINGERTTMDSDQFSGKLSRTRKLIMDDIKSKFKHITESRRRSFG